jgi:hypothetical protein
VTGRSGGVEGWAGEGEGRDGIGGRAALARGAAAAAGGPRRRRRTARRDEGRRTAGEGRRTADEAADGARVDGGDREE